MARQLADEGTDLVLVARDTERLTAVADEVPVVAEVLSADLADAAGVERVAERLQASDDPVDLLVNNAGLGFTGPFIEVERPKHQTSLAVNVEALMHLAHVAGVVFVERGHGTILNVSSIAGDLPGPESGVYNATKAFVTSLSQSMHVELKPHGVIVSCLCPGLTRTEFQDRADYDTTGLPEFLWQGAEEVAAIGLDGAAAGKPVVIPALKNKMASRLMRTMPRPLARWTAGAALNR